MRKPEYLAAGILLSALLAGCAEELPGTAAVGLLSGELRTLKEFRGRWLFVNYWAEWCAPCLEEIPELNALHEELPQVFVLGVNFDQLDAETMRPQVADLGIRFPVAATDPTRLLGLELPAVLPSTFVFDPSGARVAVLRGPQTLETLHEAMVP